MIRRSAIVAAEIVIGLVAVAALLSGLAIWRLSSGPVDLDFLTSEIESALSDPATGVDVKIGKTQLTWEGWQRTVDLHARNVMLHDASGAFVAALPDVVLQLSLRALVQGIVAPTLVEIFGAHISVSRRQDGTFQFGPWEETGGGTGGGAGPDGDFSQFVPDLIARLLAAPTPSDPLSFLRVVRIAGGRIAVNDLKLGSLWRAPYADIELRRDADGLAGKVALKLDLGGRQTNLFALLDYSKAAGQIDLVARFSDLVPQAIVSLAPGLQAVGGLTMPLAGSVSASISEIGALRSLSFNLRGDAGAFAYGTMFPTPVPVRSLRAAGTVQASEHRMTLDSAVIEFGADAKPGPIVTLSGGMTSAAEGFRGDLEIDVRATAERIAMADLARYWPAGVALGPRDWILENISRGTTRKATLNTNFTAPGGDFSLAALHEFGGTLDFADIAVHYLRPMPPVTGVSGSADFDDDRITFQTRGGRLGALEVQDTRIEITGLRPEREIMTIDLPVVGPLRDTLELLDHDRLMLIRKLDLDPGSFRGQMAARVRFDFPLLKDLGFEHIEVSALANLEQVSAKSLLLGQNVEEGRLKLVLDKAGMNLTGPVKFGGIPMDVNWTEAFSEERAEQTRVEIMAERLDAADRAVLGVSLEPYLTGPVSARIVARRDRKKKTTLEMALNLRDAALEVRPVFWRKPPGTEGSAELILELDDDRPRRIIGLELDSGTMHARGAAQFDESGQALSRLDLTRLAFETNDLSDVVIDLSGSEVSLRIGGGVLDATPWVKVAPEPKAQVASGAAVPPATPDSPPTPMRLSAKNLDAVIFGPERYLERVDIELDRRALGWERIHLRGAVPRSLWQSPKGASGADLSGDTPKTLNFEYGPGEGAGKRLLVTAEDMGAVLRALDALDTVNGGRLEIVGSSDAPLPAGKLSGRVEGHDYVLVGAPTMARLLTIASLTGISDLLNGEGIGFQRLVGEFTLENHVMHTDLMRAYGPALGITMRGDIDFDRDQIKLFGTLVPAYTVNRILGAIPFLGPLLTGGKGEGVFAATYQIRGQVGDPEITVNPLAALAPGFLRSLFSGSNIGPNELPAVPERNDP